MTLLTKIFTRSGHILLYGAVLAVLVLLLKWLQWKFLIVDHSLDIYIGLIAVFFTALGVWVSMQLTKRKVEKVVVEKEVFVPLPETFTINKAALEQLDLTKREYEVLQLVVKGYSNNEIADKLFLSLSTVKTHVSNLYVKMDVKRRAQAIDKARRLRIVE